jgi:hypothetical protein
MDDVKCRHKDANKWRERHYKIVYWTPLSGAENVVKFDVKKTSLSDVERRRSVALKTTIVLI